MPDAPQIPLPFFADVGNTPYGPPEPQARFPRGTEDPEQRHESGAVVGNARQMKNSPDSSQFKSDVAREDSVEMGTDDYGIRPWFAIGNDDISKLILKRCKPDGAQRLQENAAPLSFFEWRSRNERQANLVCFDLRLSILEDLKGLTNA